MGQIIPRPIHAERKIMFADGSIATLIGMRRKVDEWEIDFDPTPMMRYHYQITDAEFNPTYGRRFVTWRIPTKYCKDISSNTPDMMTWAVFAIPDEHRNFLPLNPFSLELEAKTTENEFLRRENHNMKVALMRVQKEIENYYQNPYIYDKSILRLVEIAKGAIQEYTPSDKTSQEGGTGDEANY